MSFLLDNLYMVYGSKVYRQKIDIPIGSDCSQKVANLFLFSYENEYVQSLVNEGQEDAELLGHTHRYIDDLLALNDMGYLERMYTKIYPSETGKQVFQVNKYFISTATIKS